MVCRLLMFMWSFGSLNSKHTGLLAFEAELVQTAVWGVDAQGGARVVAALANRK